MALNLSQAHLSWTLSALTLQRMIRRKSTWLLGLVGLMPCGLLIYWIFARVLDLNPGLMPFKMYQSIVSLYFANFYVPLLSIFLGLGVISDEIETQNITFTLVRPLSRFSIAFGRFTGHFLCGSVVIGISLLGNYLANMIFQVEDFIELFPFLLNSVFVMWFGFAAYLGIVAALGSFWKRFAILASMFWLIFDNLFSRVPVDLMRDVSVAFRMLSSFPSGLPSFWFTGGAIEYGSMTFNALVCFFYAALCVALMTWRLKAFEIVLGSGSK